MANNDNKKVVDAEVDNTELVSLEAKAKGEKAVSKELEEAKQEKEAPAKKSSKKVVKNKKSFGRKIKEIFSELKKVSWPTFSKVVKQTGVVLVVVVCFLVIIGVADVGLSALLGLLG
ncbi:MAG: preprotein translocase subunit SecE [Clostridia bacterium]